MSNDTPPANGRTREVAADSGVADEYNGTALPTTGSDIAAAPPRCLRPPFGATSSDARPLGEAAELVAIADECARTNRGSAA